MNDPIMALYAVIGILAISVGSLLKIAWDYYISRREKKEQGNTFER